MSNDQQRPARKSKRTAHFFATAFETTQFAKARDKRRAASKAARKARKKNR